MSLQGVRKIGVRRSAKKIGGLSGERKGKYQKAITRSLRKRDVNAKRPGRL